jgi:cytochrome oxidase Cu insertion factor (SCO1/SenC/PrrC family)
MSSFMRAFLRFGSSTVDVLISVVTLVSITVDPEHDGSKQLLDYSKQQGADEKGWIFVDRGPRGR